MKLSIFALMLAAATFLTGCGQSGGSYTLCGDDLISTTAPRNVLSEAIYETHDVIGHRAADRSDASFSQRSKTWDVGMDVKKVQQVVSRSTTKFADADGRQIVLEIITSKDSPTLVFITYDGAGGALKVANQVVASLQKKGVKAAF